MLFRGNSYHSIDSKSRFVIPARFRDVLKAGGGDGVMMTQLDSCIYAYDFEGWQSIESKIQAAVGKNDSMKTLRRFFIGGSFECNFDKQGRVLIPPSLRQYAKIDKEIVLIGVLDHFEIWSLENWENEKTQWENDSKNQEVKDEIAKLGL